MNEILFIDSVISSKKVLEKLMNLGYFIVEFVYEKKQ